VVMAMPQRVAVPRMEKRRFMVLMIDRSAFLRCEQVGVVVSTIPWVKCNDFARFCDSLFLRGRGTL